MPSDFLLQGASQVGCLFCIDTGIDQRKIDIQFHR